jgi:hypothetical protein
MDGAKVLQRIALDTFLQCSSQREGPESGANAKTESMERVSPEVDFPNSGDPEVVRGRFAKAQAALGLRWN